MISSQVLNLQTFLCFDFSQAELRILAQISNDTLLISQFNSGQDIHCLVGHTLTGWSVERIKQEKNVRKLVKNMQFGIIFGLQKDNLYDYVVGKIREIDGVNADLTGITKERLGQCYDRYFQRYKGVARYIQEQRYKAEYEGFVETLFGFRREIFQEDETRTTFWGNQAVNAPVQGSAHTLLLIAMALLHLKPHTYNLLQTPVMEIHDALDFFVAVRDLPGAYMQGKHLLEVGVVEYIARYFKWKMKVPLLAEASAGFCLGSCCEYEGEPVELWLPAWQKKHKDVEEKSWKEFEVTA